MAFLVTHTNGPFDGREVCFASKATIGKHENADIDLAFDPKVSGWVIIERANFGFFITVKGGIKINDKPLSDVQQHRIEGNNFNLKIGQSTFWVN